MKFLKKPIFIKKIRSYNDGIKLDSFFLNVQPSFVEQNNILKSSYVEKILDLNKNNSSIYLKGGYVYKTLSTADKPFMNISSGSLSAINLNKDDLNYYSDRDAFLIKAFKNYFKILNYKKYNIIHFAIPNRQHDI